MKKKVMTVAMMCLIAMNGNAQVYAGDAWLQMPTTDLYDTGMMNMYARAMAETAARREAVFEQYYDKAIEACKKRNGARSYILSTTLWKHDTIPEVSIS